MKLLLHLSLLLCLSVITLADSSRNYYSSAGRFHIRLASAFSVTPAIMHAENYTSTDFFSDDIKLPAARLNDVDSANANAFDISTPEYGHAIVFATSSRFPSADEMSQRSIQLLMEATARKNVPFTSIATTTLIDAPLGLNMAREFSVIHPLSETDTIFRVALISQCPTKTVGVIMSSHRRMGFGTEGMMRLIFLSVANSISMDPDPELWQKVEYHLGTVQFSKPCSWPMPLFKRGSFAMKDVHFDDSATVKELADSSTSNRLMGFQTPAMQLEIMSFPLTKTDSATLNKQIYTSLSAIGSEFDNAEINNQVYCGNLQAICLDYTKKRRGDIAHSRIYCLSHKGRLYVIRINAWESFFVSQADELRTLVESFHFH